MPKPIDQLTELERLREVVALQRMGAASGFDGNHRTGLDFLRKESRIGPVVYMFRDRGGYEAMIDHYLADAQQEYDKLKLHWQGDGTAFRQLVREKGLQNVVSYRLEKRKRG